MVILLLTYNIQPHATAHEAGHKAYHDSVWNDHHTATVDGGYSAYMEGKAIPTQCASTRQLLILGRMLSWITIIIQPLIPLFWGTSYKYHSYESECATEAWTSILKNLLHGSIRVIPPN
jgi:hypothetical protein